MTFSLFIRVLHAEEKVACLTNAITAVRAGEFNSDTFNLDPSSFEKVPGSPLAYAVNLTLIRAFSELPPLEGDGRSARVGLQTSDDYRFVRLWWEPSPRRLLSGHSSSTAEVLRGRTRQGCGWVPFAKGGSYSPFYADLHLVVDWEHDGQRLKEWTTALLGGTQWSRNIRSADAYFRPGLTWPRRTDGFSVRVLPRGCVFADKGPALLVDNDKEACLLALLGVMNAAAFLALVQLRLARVGLAQSYDVGLIQATPLPRLPIESARRIAALVSTALECQRGLISLDETSHSYIAAGIVITSCSELRQGVESITQVRSDNDQVLKNIRVEIDQMVGELYGVRSGEGDILDDLQFAEFIQDSGSEASSEGDDNNDSRVTLPSDHVQDMLMWCVGTVLGRWDVRMPRDLALAPDLQGPFEPLPVCAPGALVGPDGLPARSDGIVSEAWLRARPNVTTLPPEGSVAERTISDASYPLRIDWDGILVDDEGHPDDIVGRVREVLGLLWPDRAEVIEQEACEILGVANLREYFRNPRRFWEFHGRRYSKSRRKAPIYWLLQSSKRSYGLWLYYHRMDSDILYKALRNYVDPKIARERHRLEELAAGRAAAEAAGGRTRREHERLIDRQQALLTELEDFRQTLERVALLDLTVDHDDGVLLSIAPLHELVPWKPATQAWNELVVGKYEWSTMATRMREKGLVRGSGRQ